MTTNTKTTSRVAELRAALEQTTSALDAARSALGEAIADGDESAASEARADVARLERHAAEFEAALPVAERRAREAAQAAAQAAQRAREKAANAQRKERLAAARKVDKLMSQLGRAFAEYLSTETGGSGDDAARLARRSRHAASAALFHHAPELAHVIEPKRRPMRGHYQPLADAVGATVREFAEDEDTDA
jgi:hypothetical protein